ncbi:MAG: tyrosine-protein phosphatase [Elusimicrobiota bacterium]
MRVIAFVALLAPSAAFAAAPPAAPASREVMQLRSMQDTPSFAPLMIRRLQSNYPIWAVRARSSRELLDYVGSAALWLDISEDAHDAPLSAADDRNDDGRIDGRDIEAGLRRKLGAGEKRTEIDGAEYELGQLVAFANRYRGEVPGKVVELPRRERELMDEFAALELVENSTAGYRVRQEAGIIFLTGRSGKQSLEHELTHALYCAEPAFRAEAARIWKDLPAAARELVLNALSRVYGLQDQELILTEFAAYGVTGFPGALFNVPRGSPLREAARRLREAQADYLSPAAAPRCRATLPNFRDLGGRETVDGRRIKAGRVFRSEQLAALDCGAEFSRLGITQIVDFRGAPEKAVKPDPDMSPAAAIALPIFDDAHPEEDVGAQLAAKVTALGAARAANDAAAVTRATADLESWSATLKPRMVDAYVQFATNPAVTKQFGAFLSHAARRDQITLFHCAAGKDRTGFAAAILLSGLGVSWEDVLADYLVSNTALAERNRALIDGISQIWTKEPGRAGPETLQAILGVDAEYLTTAFRKIQDQYGDGYPAGPGEAASRGAIERFYAEVFGPTVQDDLKRALLR